jgi:hypothetical protein
MTAAMANPRRNAPTALPAAAAASLELDNEVDVPFLEEELSRGCLQKSENTQVVLRTHLRMIRPTQQQRKYLSLTNCRRHRKYDTVHPD